MTNKRIIMVKKIILILLILFLAVSPVYAAVQIIDGGVGGTDPNNGRKLARTSDGTLWVVYDGDHYVYAVNSTDDGVTWNTPLMVNDGGITDQWQPSIAIDSNDVIHIVWVAWGTSYNIQYRNRTNGVWGIQEGVTNSASMQFEPSIAIDSNDVIHVTWDGKGWGVNTGIYNLQYRNCTVSGWGTIEAITDSASSQIYPAIGIDNNDDIHITWYGEGWGVNTGIQNIQYINRTISGWGVQEGITDIASEQYSSSIAIDNNDNIHLTWHGKGWGTNTGNNNIQYRNYTVSGWGVVEQVTDLGGVGDQRAPSIAIDNNDDIHVIWYSLGRGVNTGIWNIQYINRTISGWGVQEGITDIAVYPNWKSSSMWAMYPLIDGAQPNVPETGTTFVWTDYTGGDSVWYDGMYLTWQTPSEPESQYPSDVNFSIDGTQIYYNAGNLNTAESMPSFADEINTYLSTCVESIPGYCDVPLTFETSDAGNLLVNGLSINYNDGDMNFRATIMNTGFKDTTLNTIYATSTTGDICLFTPAYTEFGVGDFLTVSNNTCPITCNNFLSFKATTTCGTSDEFTQTPSGC
ncbi:hypothetical protein GQ473_05045 [archaeon]|nr:hypothetical protein [archaeon]